MQKQKRLKMAFFGDFDLFFGISIVRPLNFNNFFTATDAPTYFLKMYINIFVEKLFADN